MCVWLLFDCGIYFIQELQIVWLLFEASVYSKKYSICHRPDKKWCQGLKLWYGCIIGASLSDPHTSVTALRMRVCIYACVCLFAEEHVGVVVKYLNALI